VIGLLSYSILKRVRTVFTKHCLSWMLHGYLQENSAFFVQANKRSSMDGEQTEYKSGARVVDSRFDWNSSYLVKFPLIPESIVSGSLVSKIVFSGKAVLMITQSDSSGPNLSSYHVFSRSLKDFRSSSAEYDHMAILSGVDVATRKHLEGMLASGPMDIANNEFERLVVGVHDSISRFLWRHLYLHSRFPEFFTVIRNSYFLGKGELFQCIIDRVLSFADNPTPASYTMNRLLKTKVLADSYKQLNIDEDEVGRVLRLSAKSLDTSITSFAHQSNEYFLQGSVLVESSPSVGSLICFRSSHESGSAEQQRTVWRKLSAHAEGYPSHDVIDDVEKMKECSGSVWLKETRPVGKGFLFCAEFSLDPGALAAALARVSVLRCGNGQIFYTRSIIAFQFYSPNVESELLTFSFCLRDNRPRISAVDIPDNSLVVSVTFVSKGMYPGA
jgi:hypothetical protein